THRGLRRLPVSGRSTDGVEEHDAVNGGDERRCIVIALRKHERIAGLIDGCLRCATLRRQVGAL
ncbi:MAG: hypothetical protein U1E29_11905, partial [Coriobacteriia bacterium]|nr:hypothetical protein [Coriobacteriia bacterium]